MIIDDIRIDVATTLEVIDTAQRMTAVEAAVIEYGGTFVPPAKPGAAGTWGPHYAELSLLGVSHHGATSSECIAQWIKAVFRMHATAGEAAA